MGGKRIVLGALLVFGLAMVSEAYAQVPLTLGARGGVSVSQASFDIGETFDKSNQTGISAGAFLNWDLGIFAFQPEVNYVEKGVKDGTTDEEFNFRYVEGVALLKAGLPLGIAKISALGGVSAAFEIDCKNKDSGGEVACSDIGLETKSPEWNAVFGVDVGIFLGGISLWGDARYAMGLNAINEAEDIVSDLKNRAWILTAGIGFALK
jgi:hypothetical protein